MLTTTNTLEGMEQLFDLPEERVKEHPVLKDKKVHMSTSVTKKDFKLFLTETKGEDKEFYLRIAGNQQSTEQHIHRLRVCYTRAKKEVEKKGKKVAQFKMMVVGIYKLDEFDHVVQLLRKTPDMQMSSAILQAIEDLLEDKDDTEEAQEENENAS